MMTSTTRKQSISQTVAHEGEPPRAGGHYRWTICGLLFFATTVNYMDRQVLSLLKPTLKESLGWSETDYGMIIFWFQAAYALGNVGAGRMIDKLGVRMGLAFSVAGWSVMAMFHAMARSVGGFAAARFGLGLTEGGNFPGAIKAVGEWFPRRERALATGIFNSGSNIGALVTPPLVWWINEHWGWEACFISIGALGFVWLILWFLFYGPPQTHPRLSASERAYIMSDPPAPAAHVPWFGLLGYRQTWAFCAAMFLVAPVWWFYLYWIPSFLHDRYGLDLLQMGLPLVMIYTMASVGGIGGGWISGTLLRRGWSVNAARKTALFICACCVVPVAAGPLVSKWMAVALVGLAAAAHQGFAANMYTMVSDTVRRDAVSSVVGIGGLCGAVGGMMVAWLTGRILDLTNNNYQTIFVAAAAMYLVALAIIHVLLPCLEPMSTEAKS